MTAPAQAPVAARANSFSLALIGEGITASLTPALHEQEGRRHGLSVTYRIIDSALTDLTPADLPDLLRWARRFGMAGLNVTHPFKQAIIPHLDGLSERAADLGAVNTVVLDAAGRAIGHNTDWCGYAGALQEALPHRDSSRVVLLGAGGAGTAVAYALLTGGAEQLTVVDPRAEVREALVARMARRFGSHRVKAGQDVPGELARATGLVNATPVGMATHPGTPVPVDLIRPDTWVSEIIYFPVETPLLRAARERGCATVDGTGMAVGQAVEAFALFTGRFADPDRMAAHLHSLLPRPR